MSVYEKFIHDAALDTGISSLTSEYEVELDCLFEQYARYRTTPTVLMCNTGIVFFDIPVKDVVGKIKIPGLAVEDIISLALKYWRQKMASSDLKCTIVEYHDAISVIVYTDTQYHLGRSAFASADFRTYKTEPIRKRARPDERTRR